MRILDLGEYYFGRIRVYQFKQTENDKGKFSITDLYEGDISKTPTEILFMNIKSFHVCGMFLDISVE